MEDATFETLELALEIEEEATLEAEEAELALRLDEGATLEAELASELETEAIPDEELALAALDTAEEATLGVEAAFDVLDPPGILMLRLAAILEAKLKLVEETTLELAGFTLDKEDKEDKELALAALDTDEEAGVEELAGLTLDTEDKKDKEDKELALAALDADEEAGVEELALAVLDTAEEAILEATFEVALELGGAELEGAELGGATLEDEPALGTAAELELGATTEDMLD